MRGDRLVMILLLLQSYGKMTAKQLAERLEVTERTIYRDMEALSSAGIPVYAERGKNGGWLLLDDYQTKLTGLKEDEIRALFVSPSEKLLADLGMIRSTENARNKLLAALPRSYREQAKTVWNRIHIDTSTWRKQKETASSFEILKDAIWQEHQLQIQYLRADGTTIDRIVHPLGLVAKGSRWYLVASTDNETIRTYRASRIHCAQLLDESFTRPKNFNLAQYWEDSTTSFISKLPQYKVIAEARPSILPRLTFTDRFVQIEKMETKEETASWIPIKLIFQTEEEAKGYLLGFANQIRVIKPKELHKQLIAMAQSVIDLYQ